MVNALVDAFKVNDIIKLLLLSSSSNDILIVRSLAIASNH